MASAGMDPATSLLLTDIYQLNMIQAYPAVVPLDQHRHILRPRPFFSGQFGEHPRLEGRQAVAVALLVRFPVPRTP
jgi:hypothetical protein